MLVYIHGVCVCVYIHGVCACVCVCVRACTRVCVCVCVCVCDMITMTSFVLTTRLAVDRWGMLPDEVNAFFSSTYNQVVLLAGLLQRPYFDLNFPLLVYFVIIPSIENPAFNFSLNSGCGFHVLSFYILHASVFSVKKTNIAHVFSAIDTVCIECKFSSHQF